VQEELSLTMQSYMAFLTDETRLIANPGLKEGIREEEEKIERTIHVGPET
jgi:hypothetical protein